MARNNVLPRSIVYLMAVAENQSFTRAAEALYISQPTLSQQIKQLEDSLNTQLLDRSGRHVQLTAAGDIYLNHAKRALSELENAERAINNLDNLSRGSLRMAMTPIPDYLTIPLLAEFTESYPGITISTFEMPQTEMRDALLENHVDIGIAFSSTLTNDMCSSIAHCHTLLIEKLRLVIGSDHPLCSSPGPLSKHVLEEEPLILFNNNYALRKHIDQYCLEQGVTPQITMEASSLSVIMEMVRRGKLATILPATIAQQQHGLKSIALLPDLPHHTISLICGKEINANPSCRAFRKMATDFFSSNQHTSTDNLLAKPA